MLQDLEARQDTAAPTPTRPVHQDLRPVRTPPRVNVMRLALFVVIAGVVVAGIYFGADKIMLARVEAPTVPAAKPQPAPPVARTPVPPVPDSAPASSATVPTADAALSATPVPAPPVSVVEAPKPPATQVQESAAVIPPAPTAPPVAAEPKVTPDASAQSPRSPSRAPVGIVVKKAEPPSVVAIARERRPADVKAPQPKSEAALASSEESATLVDKKVRPLTAEESAEAGYRRGLHSLDQRRPDEALRQLREALAAQPTHIKARELAAGIELQNGHWREAQSLLEEGLRQVSNHYLFARMLARVYVDHGAEAKALAVMESALPAGSDDAEFSALLGLLYQRANRHQDAIRAYERAITLRPNDGRTWLGFAISLEGTEQWSAAKNAYRRAQENELTPSLARYAEQRIAALKDR